MKLVDILARDLKEWPEEFKVLFVTQDQDGTLYGWQDSHPECLSGEWVWRKGRPARDLASWRPGKFDGAEDRSTSIVTRSQWQAAVDALKAGVCEHSHGNGLGCPECGEEFALIWSGEGNPPVGIDCETLWSSTTGEYVPVRVVGIDGDRVVVRFTDGARKGEYDSDTQHFGYEYPIFRPARTAEQIAADHLREKYLPELERLWDADTRRPDFLEAVLNLIKAAAEDGKQEITQLAIQPARKGGSNERPAD